MANIHDVARLAGVASVTVSRFLNASGPVSSASRRKIEAAVDALGYVPNALAQGLKSRATHTIGLVVSDVTNPFFTSIARGVEDVAQQAGYSVILCNSDENVEKQAIYLEVLRRKRMDGLLIAPASEDGRAILEWSRHCGPVCILDRTISHVDVQAVGIDVVRSDSVDAAERLVTHLVSHGHRRIGIITGPEDISTASARLEGYRRSLRTSDISPDPTLERRGPFTVESGYAAAASLLNESQPPTAIFAANNFITIGVLAALRDRGLSVPQRVAVVGFDEIPQIALAAPFLTVAAQAATTVGRQGARFLLERVSALRGGGPPPAGHELVLETEMIIRQSCGCPVDEAPGLSSMGLQFRASDLYRQSGQVASDGSPLDIDHVPSKPATTGKQKGRDQAVVGGHRGGRLRGET